MGVMIFRRRREVGEMQRAMGTFATSPTPPILWTLKQLVQASNNRDERVAVGHTLSVHDLREVSQKEPMRYVFPQMIHQHCASLSIVQLLKRI